MNYRLLIIAYDHSANIILVLSHNGVTPSDMPNLKILIQHGIR